MKYAILLGFLACLSLFAVFFVFIQPNLFSQSQARVYLNGSVLNVDFKLTTFDQEKIAGRWFQNLSIELNQKSADLIDPFLPKTVYLKFKEDKMEFSDNKFPLRYKDFLLTSPAPADLANWATGSAKLAVKRSADNYFIVEIKDPATLLITATQAGFLKLSPKISDSLMTVVKRLDRIEMKLGNDYLDGQIKFR